MQAVPIQARAAVQAKVRRESSAKALATITKIGMPQATVKLRVVPTQSRGSSFTDLPIAGQPAQQDSFETSVSKVWEASLKPSTVVRSEKRRVGQEWGSTCRYRWS